MLAWLGDWASLVVRWTHVLAAIAWIGHAFFFHGIHEHLGPPKEKAPSGAKVEGEMWMIHGGGFFFLQKTKDLPREALKDLLWFKWESGFTWLSGFLLLSIVFYGSGGVYLTDPTVSGVGRWAATGIGLASLAGGWLAYDLLWRSPLAKDGRVAATISVLGYVAVAYGLCHVLSGRAAFLHAGAMLATIMAGNVWMVIIPSQQKLVRAIEAGEAADYELAAKASRRSGHNAYMQWPVVVTMISNHYPATYAHPYNWVVLLLLVVVGACARQLMFEGRKAHPAFYGAIAAAVAALAALTMPSIGGAAVADVAAVGTSSSGKGGKAVDPSTVGSIAGHVAFRGTPPAPKELELAGCPHDGPVYDDAVRVKDGGLADVFVWLSAGTDGWEPPPAPKDEVVLDQKGCMYSPHVVGVRVGQPVTFVNSDSLVHNVRAVTSANDTFNETMVARDQRITKVFRRPEQMLKSKCDIHPWMSAYVGLVDTPWFAVSGDDGAFEIRGVPPGTYTLSAWHEVYGTQTQTVTVPASGAATADWTFGS